MPPSALERRQFVVDWSKARWLASTTTYFSNLSEMALQGPLVSSAFALAGVDPGKVYRITYGSKNKLDIILHNIHAQHGPVHMNFCGRDVEGKCYVNCSQPGKKWAVAVICVSAADKKNRTATEPSKVVIDGEMQDREEWEEVIVDGIVVEDDWVKV